MRTTHMEVSRTETPPGQRPSWTDTLCEQNDMQVLKHYLHATSLQAVKNTIRRFPLPRILEHRKPKATTKVTLTSHQNGHCILNAISASIVT